MRKAAMLAATDHGFVVLTTGTAGDGRTIFKNLSSKPQEIGRAARGKRWDRLPYITS